MVHLSCADSAFINPDGSTGDVILPGAPPFDLPTDLPTFSTQSVSPGTTFTAEAPTATINVPNHLDPLPGLSVDVNEAKNIKTWIKVNNAASIGTPTISGGTVTNATAQKTGADEILLTFPGNKTGSTVPAGNLYFKGGSSFTSPKVSLPVTAKNAAGDITFSVEKFQTDSAVVINVPPALGARAACTPSGDASLGSITVKDPRAPDAINDSASTKPGQPITIAVLDNDKPNGDGQAPDPSTLAIASNPHHGKALADTTESTITYTPDAGFTGTDSFTYQVCDSVEQITAGRAATQFCDTATVTVTVAAPVTQQGGSSTTTTTAAKELPRTGRSSMPLAFVGFGSCFLGAFAVGASRRRATN